MPSLKYTTSPGPEGKMVEDKKLFIIDLNELFQPCFGIVISFENI